MKSKGRKKAKVNELMPKNNISEEFSASEIDEALKMIKSGKVAGLDGVYSEFLKHCGPYKIVAHTIL